MFAGHPVIDGDSHKFENWVVMLDYIPSQYRDRIRPEPCSRGFSRVALYDRNPVTGVADVRRLLAKPEGLSKGLFASFHREGTLGSMFNRVRLEHMDREGIDISIIYPTVTLGLNAMQDKDFAISVAKAYNDYIMDDSAVSPDRLLPIALIPLADVSAAVEEMERCWAKGFLGFAVAPNVPVPHPDAPHAFPDIAIPKTIAHPDFRPILAKAVELGASLGIHGAGPGMYMPGGIYDFTDNFMINHIFAHRNQMQLAVASCVFEGVFEQFPTLKIGFLEGGVGWVPDILHAFHEHWEKRVRDFDPDLQLDLKDYARELRAELGDQKATELSLRHRRSVMSQLVFHRRNGGVSRFADRSDRYTWESSITTDPMEFFRRGQAIFGFESDDPAVSYLEHAMGGEWASHLPMFSVDYGHWDGEVEGCVSRVADNELLPVHVRRRALGENATRHYGHRLAQIVQEMQRGAGVTVSRTAPAISF